LRVEQRAGRLVDGDDVELEVDVVGGPVHLGGHVEHALVVVGLEGEVVAVGHRQRPEPVVELRGGDERLAQVVLAAEDRLVVGAAADELVDLTLLGAAAGRQLRGAEQEERDDAHVGDEEDREQPAERH